LNNQPCLGEQEKQWKILCLEYAQISLFIFSCTALQQHSFQAFIITIITIISIISIIIIIIP
jgi:hypothetical protein